MTIAITVLFVIALFVAGSEECFGKSRELKSPALSQYSSGTVPTNLFVTAKGVSYNGTISNYVEPSVLFSDNGLSIILGFAKPCSPSLYLGAYTAKGSPELLLNPSAYLKNGGPVDPSTFTTYSIMGHVL